MGTDTADRLIELLLGHVLRVLLLVLVLAPLAVVVLLLLLLLVRRVRARVTVVRVVSLDLVLLHGQPVARATAHLSEGQERLPGLAPDQVVLLLLEIGPVQVSIGQWQLAGRHCPKAVEWVENR